MQVHFEIQNDFEKALAAAPMQITVSVLDEFDGCSVEEQMQGFTLHFVQV